MKWSLQEINKFKEEGIIFETTLDVKENLMSREKEILDLSPIFVKGIVHNDKQEYILHYDMEYTITLPSARSLTPVDLTMKHSIDEVFQTKEMFESSKEIDGQEEILIIEGQSISLVESVADNILLEIPLKVLTPEEEESAELPSGAFWSVWTEKDYQENAEQNNEETIDPRLAKLQEFLNKENEQE